MLLANITEIIFQVVFLLFLLLRSTSDITDCSNKFSGHVNSDTCSDSGYGVTDLTVAFCLVTSDHCNITNFLSSSKPKFMASIINNNIEITLLAIAYSFLRNG